jgi:hypothetical protein
MKDIIIPFCIYHYIDPATQTYWGYIGGPEKVRNEDGSTTYRCVSEPKVLKRWFLAATFYAVSPSFRPIPVGMRIFCAKKNRSYPYNTKDVTAVYDPYNIKDDCVYFTTYNQPVPNTEQLYFHTIGDTVFPSFDQQPPFDDPQRSQTHISPIFVMTPSTVGNNPNNIKFKCINRKCLPWVKNIPNVYDIDQNDDLLSIDDCVLFCSELVLSKSKGRPFDLIQTIVAGSERKPVVSRFFKKLPPWVIGMSISVFVILLFTIVYTLIKNKNENGGGYRRR